MKRSDPKKLMKAQAERIRLERLAGVRPAPEPAFLPEDMLDPTRFKVIAFTMREGVALWAHRMEFLHFRPGDPELNDKYQIYAIPWKGSLFLITSFPLSALEVAQKEASDLNLKLVPGVPVALEVGESAIMVTGRLTPDYKPDRAYVQQINPLRIEDQQWFPARGPHVYTIENLKGPMLMRGATKEEQEAADALLERERARQREERGSN